MHRIGDTRVRPRARDGTSQVLPVGCQNGLVLNFVSLVRLRPPADVHCRYPNGCLQVGWECSESKIWAEEPIRIEGGISTVWPLQRARTENRLDPGSRLESDSWGVR